MGHGVYASWVLWLITLLKNPMIAQCLKGTQGMQFIPSGTVSIKIPKHSTPPFFIGMINRLYKACGMSRQYLWELSVQQGIYSHSFMS